MKTRDVRRPPLRPRAEAVLAAIRANPGSSVPRLADITDLTWTQVRAVVTTLTDRDLVEVRTPGNILGQRPDSLRCYPKETA